MNELLKLKEASELTGVPVSVIRRAVNNGELERATSSYHIYIRKDQLFAWLENRERKRRMILPQGNIFLDSDESLKFIDAINNAKAFTTPCKYLTDNLYAVSNRGNVFNLDYRRKLAPTTATHGYLQVSLPGMAGQLYERVHVLVAAVWCPNRRHKPHVHHINDDKTDNRAENLVWTLEIEHHKAHKLLKEAKESSDYTEYNRYIEELRKDNAWSHEHRCILFPKDNATIFVWLKKEAYEDLQNGIRSLNDIYYDEELFHTVVPQTVSELTGGKFD